ncbi:glucan endo-1,3-beta-glucosidase 12 [Salvia miltiorrhiza]|uniref:glucan endo-1,3-beta-glucosidase 12 n=1 Tax=Salvia miltiorrhiza TaxID=226208 RepID=UPI0025AC384C|nr:glucan endo-1,3-beta-glucosidase 12 [Salvia miltiorrhiza]
MNMVVLLSLFFSLLCFTAQCQEPLQLSPLQPHLPPAAGVHVEPQHLQNVSDSVLAAEAWLRKYVLAHFPATNITTIVAGSAVLCRRDQQHNLGLLLPALNNLHHSLTRWGLHRQIKVAAAFSSDCLDPLSESYRDDVGQSYIKPLLTFLQQVGSPYVVNPPPEFLRSAVGESHLKSMKDLGVSEMNVILSSARRKLSHKVNPFPPRPAPTLALPPLVGTLPPQPSYGAPYIAPMGGPRLPPCEPAHWAPAPAAVGHVHHGTWCVAKPSVPAETLQEALDYACGEGDADCEAIKEDGSCFHPDTLVAHASYAFNSYWQKTKANGGTCGFGGTAIIITSDPSYGRCRFALT